MVLSVWQRGCFTSNHVRVNFGIVILDICTVFVSRLHAVLTALWGWSLNKGNSAHSWRLSPTAALPQQFVTMKVAPSVFAACFLHICSLLGATKGEESRFGTAGVKVSGSEPLQRRLHSSPSPRLVLCVARSTLRRCATPSARPSCG